MKIAFLTLHFPPEWLAGIEIATYNIADELSKSGHDVHVITASDDKSYRHAKNGFSVHYVPYPTRIPVLSLLAFFVRVYQQVREIRPDVLHIQSLLWGWMGVVIRTFQKIPYVTNGHGDDIYLDSRLKDVSLRFNLKRANAVVALTNDMKEQVEKIYRRQIFVVPNGVDLDKFNKAPRGSRSIYGLSDDDQVITFLGGLRHVKGLEHLVGAFLMIRSSHPKAKLVIAGEGEEKPRLESLVERHHLQDSVIFVGRLGNGEVPALLGSSDLLALPSLSEGFPLVVLEAMAAGLPIVGTKVGGMPDIIIDGKNGYLVPPGDPEELAEKITHILDDPTLMNGMSRNNLEMVKSYRWACISQRMEAIYQAVILPSEQSGGPETAALHTK